MLQADQGWALRAPRPPRTGRLRPLTALLGVLGLLVSIVVVAPTAQAWTVLCQSFTQCNSRGYSNYGYEKVYTQSFWSQSKGHNCTNYVAYRMIQDGMSTTWPGSKWGYARDWGSIYASRTDQTPTAGSVAWWGTEFSSTGHVAYVEEVLSSTELLISEDNWGGDFRWRKVVKGTDKWPLGFIHLAGSYVPLSPTRLLDTRSGLGAPTGRVPAGGEVAVQVTGRGGVPTKAVDSVVLNATAVSPSYNGFLTVYASGVSRPNASNLNYVSGRTIANQVVAKVGTDGKIRVNVASPTHVLLDVVGYYPSGDNLAALTPARILDTRSGVGAPAGRIPPGGKLDLKVTGVGGVPASGAASVALNVTAARPSAQGWLTAWPAGGAMPNASNVNYATQTNVAGLVVAKVGSAGKVSISSSASTDVVVDVVGWFPVSSDYAGASPSRILDTRAGVGAPAGPVGSSGALTVQVTGRGGVPTSGVKAVMLNVTSVDAAGSGFVTAYPSGVSRPTASTLNYGTEAAVANSVLAKVGSDGRVVLYASAGTYLIADVQGYVTK